ncbi:MarR family winged helix-turn-helix transcriptional regulator [Actinoplanes sp. L3-i22]|uniref:MarR family winged helix-turn-helix transcriptional regulator n=1 Tax=Actinoplanes sp. L3-i22 TaxID=2836373 RepID=UPI001C74E848|nr:MarR family transcriptional regulator [Actinoplanes sp. L3-i22]BCY08401.1 transcriptional regulator [Actinoplanes sp. L3-i22]
MASTTALFDDLVRCETRLYNAANDRLRDRHGIVTSQFEFLRFVRDHAGCRVADIAATFAIGIGATSKGIDRLEARGLVVRQPNPVDRRSSLLALTPEGAELATAAEQTVDAVLTELLERNLAPGAISAVAQAMADLRAALERDQIGLPTG